MGISTVRQPGRSAGMGATCALILLITGCAGGSSPAPSGSSTQGTDGSASTVSPSGTTVSEGSTSAGSVPSGGTPNAAAEQQPSAADAAICEAKPGRTVTMLPEVRIPEQRLAAQTLAGASIGGGTVPEQTLPELVMPAQTAWAGCIVRHEAPGGCVGAVEISPAYIPPAVIPGQKIPAVTLANGTTIPERNFPEVSLPAVRVPGATTQQVCQLTTEDRTVTVSRAGVVRQEVSRPGAARPGGRRSQVCESGGCLPEVDVETMRAEPVRIPAVDVDPERLQGKRLEAGVESVEDDRQVSFIAPADVLFDTDKSVLRPAARDSLREIARQMRRALAKTGAKARIEVDGHTDARGTTAHNEALSLARAKSVSSWLTGPGGVTGRTLQVRGFGERVPAAPNDTAANLQRNRRVVVTIRFD